MPLIGHIEEFSARSNEETSGYIGKKLNFCFAAETIYVKRKSTNHFRKMVKTKTIDIIGVKKEIKGN